MEQWNNENTEYTNQTITIKQGWGKMLEKEKNQHKGEIEESIDYKT